MTKITNMYYDVFTNETIQRVDRWWYWLGHKEQRVEGYLEELNTPAEEILRACKRGEWEIVKQEAKTETLYLLKEKNSNTLFYSFFFYSVFSSNGFSLSLNGHKADDMFTYFEGASIAYALQKIRKDLRRKEAENNKQEIIKDFEVWK
jgi:hypothetical protein